MEDGPIKPLSSTLWLFQTTEETTSAFFSRVKAYPVLNMPTQAHFRIAHTS